MKRLSLALLPVLVASCATTSTDRTQDMRSVIESTPPVLYKTVEVQGVDVFYREAGSPDAPTLLLLHGFPSSSHMFRDLIPKLSDRYHVVAPDYPGFGQSSMPARDAFEYTFENLSRVVEGFTDALGLETYSLYLMDYGAPIGLRLATRNPERVQALVIQNGNAYEEGLSSFTNPLKRYWKEPTPENREALRGMLTLDATRWHYTDGARDPARISPDNWVVDQQGLDRPGNQEIQLDLFYDYRTNVALYPAWQAYLRTAQPPTLIVWGKNDKIFPAEGAHPFKRDLEKLEFHLLDTGHFALEEDSAFIAAAMHRFLAKHVGGN